jgi:hypothetical protein
MAIKYRNLDSQLKWALDHAGIMPGIAAQKAMVYASSSAAPYVYWTGQGRNGGIDQMYSSLSTAEAAMTTGRNDVIMLTPESHSLSTTLTWDVNMTHLVGMYGPSRIAQRSRIGMSTTFSPMITVSGYGNTFSNIYTMHGTASTDYIGWSITGNRNSFLNCHFAGPMIAAQGGHASYNGVALTATDCYFRDCTFGTGTIARDELTPNLTITVPSTGFAHNVFENCTFILNATDTDPYFVALANTSGVLMTEFIGCRFICLSDNMAVAAAVAFTVSSGSTCLTTLDQNCEFINVTKLAASASMKYLWTPTVFAATADELNLIAINSATY